MKLSREKLQAESRTTGFRAEVLEKVFQLLNLLELFHSHPFLKDRLALKGGTALNLFLFDLPRLSLDVDLNYIGAVEREKMEEERPRVEQAIRAVCAREGFNIVRLPGEHAGGKWQLRYASALTEGGNLELDLNFMFRVPLWPVVERDSNKIGSRQAKAIPVLDLHELAAGKLAALLSRHAIRDLFDAHLLLTQGKLDAGKLRLGFVLYGAMNRKDWRTVRPDDIQFEAREIESQLVPVTRREFHEKLKMPEDWARRLGKEVRQHLGTVFPLATNEREFLDRLLDHGELAPALLTSDEALSAKIKTHPLLQWKALNVRKHKKMESE